MSRATWCLAFLLLACSPAIGAVAGFDPLVDPSGIVAGTPMPFSITVGVESLSGFNWADVIIGIDEPNAGVSFVYSSEWNAAFSNVSSITYDLGFYPHDVFVGGNNPTSVGTGLSLGTVTVDTTGLALGIYEVKIDNTFDSTSALGLDTESEALLGSGTFRIIAEPTSIFLLLGCAGLVCKVRGRR